jgi:hypothetical protein
METGDGYAGTAPDLPRIGQADKPRKPPLAASSIASEDGTPI